MVTAHQRYKPTHGRTDGQLSLALIALCINCVGLLSGKNRHAVTCTAELERALTLQANGIGPALVTLLQYLRCISTLHSNDSDISNSSSISNDSGPKCWRSRTQTIGSFQLLLLPMLHTVRASSDIRPATNPTYSPDDLTLTRARITNISSVCDCMRRGRFVPV